MVRINTTGATTLRSRAMRITRITASTSGMITLRSRMEVSRVSMLVAVSPPIWAAPSSSVRSSRTVSDAWSLSAASVRVASSRTWPSLTVGVGAGVPGGPSGWMPSAVTGAVPAGESAAMTETESTPSLASSTSVTSWSRASSVRTRAGLPDPAGKCSARAAWPSRASDWPSTNSLGGTPSALSVGTKAAPAASAIAQITQTVRGRRDTRPAALA